MYDERTARWFWERVDQSGECWLWMRARDGNGYGRTHLAGYPRRKRFGTHRIAYELTYGPIPPGLLVCHRCDNPPCCRPDHLFLGDKRANALDARDKGRLRGVTLASERFHAIGSSHGMAKLNEEKVTEIRARLAAGESVKAVATAFGVSWMTVSRIRRAIRWTHVASTAIPFERAPHRGSSHHAAKLTEADVLTIRRRLSQGERGLDLAKEYGVTGSTISRIKVRRDWRHI